MYVDYLLSSLRPLMSLMRGPFTGALSYREKREPTSARRYHLNHFTSTNPTTTTYRKGNPHTHTHPPNQPRVYISGRKRVGSSTKPMGPTILRYSFQTCDRVSRHDEMMAGRHWAASAMNVLWLVSTTEREKESQVGLIRRDPAGPGVSPQTDTNTYGKRWEEPI
jgi:hypothetical protein